MTTATIPEEELLIITEEEEITDEINLDLSEVKEEKTKWDIISFWEEDKKESIKINLEENSSDNKENIVDSEIWNNGLDFSFDLWGEEKEVTVEDMLWEKTNSLKNEEVISTEEPIKENTEDIFSFDLWDNSDKPNKTEKIEDNILKEDLEKNIEEKLISLDVEEKDTKEAFNFNVDTEEKWEIEEALNDNEINIDFALPITENNVKKEVSSEKTLDQNVKEVIEEEKKEEAQSTEKSKEDNTSSKTTWTSKKDDSQSSWKSDDTNTILDETIQKLKLRKKEIIELKKETLTSIGKLKDEIKLLQSNVRVLTKSSKDNDKETDKIDENVKLLTKMKV